MGKLGRKLLFATLFVAVVSAVLILVVPDYLIDMYARKTFERISLAKCSLKPYIGNMGSYRAEALSTEAYNLTTGCLNYNATDSFKIVVAAPRDIDDLNVSDWNTTAVLCVGITDPRTVAKLFNKTIPRESSYVIPRFLARTILIGYINNTLFVGVSNTDGCLVYKLLISRFFMERERMKHNEAIVVHSFYKSTIYYVESLIHVVPAILSGEREGYHVLMNISYGIETTYPGDLGITVTNTSAYLSISSCDSGLCRVGERIFAFIGRALVEINDRLKTIAIKYRQEHPICVTIYQPSFEVEKTDGETVFNVEFSIADEKHTLTFHVK